MPKLTDEQREMYRTFVDEFCQCWACAFQPLPDMGVPSSMNPLENAHIVGGSGRRADRRCIARLCRIHHQIFDGSTYRFEGEALPRMSIEQVVWLKGKFDPDNLDIEFLKSLRIKRFQEINPVPLEPFKHKG